MKNSKHIPLVCLKALVLGALGVVTQVHAAAPFTPNDQPSGYTAPMALSTDCIEVGCTLVAPTNTSGGGKAYRPWFENGSWQGDLVEYTVTAAGAITTSIDLTTDPPTNSGANWSARINFNAAAAASATWWTDTPGRKIISTNGGGSVQVGGAQKAFRWDQLSATQKSALDSATAAAGPSPVLNFVRGDRTLEKSALNPTGAYRQRYNVLGDIMHSNPVYVAAPKSNYGFDNYGTFKSANMSRAARIYVGANDGMLHAFDATGAEIYAYIPSMLIGNLGKLKANPYAHTYFVDGPLTAGDAYVGGSWKTVLVGGLGAGGKGVFALDVTNPSLSAETANSGTDDKVLWELTATADNDLGYTYSKPVIARLNDNKWYAVIGNGYNSVDGIAKLYLINLATGAVTKISTASGSAGSPNGLSSPTLVDVDGAVNGDVTADYAYAGDIDGNLWKFDLSSTTPASWTVSYKLHAGSSTKAITTAPDLVGYGNPGNYLVYFGTGRAFTSADLVDDAVAQSIYAIYDKGTAPGIPSLITQALTETTHTSGKKVRILGKTAIDWVTATGWKIDLPLGERLLTNPVVRAERLQFITTNPAVTNNEFGIGAAAWLMEPDYLTGSSPLTPVFDLDENTKLDGADNVSTSVVGGWNSGTDLVSQPVFAIKQVLANSAGTVDTLFYNNLILPYVENCTGNCTGGFIGGHVDVDTDSPTGPVAGKTADGLGLLTDGHQHEYDKTHGVVYADYFNLEPRRGLASLNPKDVGKLAGKSLNRVTEVNPAPISGTKQFVVVLANADLSPKGTLKIGTKEWNVVDYQNMVTAKLKALGNTPLTAANFTDNDGASLVFTRDGIQAGGGTLSISFDNHAIIQGGLIPGQTGCVQGGKNPYGSKTNFTNQHITRVPVTPDWAAKDLDPNPNVRAGYRWRNGALTLQLLDAASHTLQESTWWPQDVTGTKFEGGLWAKEVSTVTLSSGKPTAFTVSEGANESGLLYESTLFWHYGDLNTYDGVAKPCYGAGGYNDAIKNEREGLSLAQYLTLTTGLSNTDSKVVNYAKALKNLADELAKATPDETKVDDLVIALNAAINITTAFADYVKYRGYVGGGQIDINNPNVLDIDKQNIGTGTGNGGAPAAVTGNPDTTGNTVGPNYKPGRRTWTEITPKS